tara:strand:+ start:799 stop:1011 length:213 start_codon:yes stop_codon:yes gene_type:complete
MSEKDLKKLLKNTNLVSALVFINPDTHAVIIHLDGFEDLEHGRKFTDEMFKKSGIKFTAFDDAWETPTIH